MPTNSTDNSASYYLALVRDLLGTPHEKKQKRGGEPERIGDGVDPEKKLAAMFALGNSVMDRLDESAPLQLPDRPADFPMDDFALYRVLHDINGRRGQMTADQQRITRLFRNWSENVRKREHQSASNLELLLGILDTFRQIDEPAAEEKAETLCVFIREHWPRLDPDNVPPRSDIYDRERLIRHANRRDDLIASWLLHGGKPPRSAKPDEGKARHQPHWMDEVERRRDDD